MGALFAFAHRAFQARPILTSIAGVILTILAGVLAFILIGIGGAFLMRFGFVGILAVLGAAAGVAGLASAPGGKDTTVGSAVLFAALLAFAAFALTMPAVLL